MKMTRVILFLLVTAVAVSSFSKKKFTDKDYRHLAKKAVGCIKTEDRECLISLIQSSVYLALSEPYWGCKGGVLTSRDYVDCILTSKVPYDEYIKKTLKEAMLECFTDKESRILLQYTQFKSKSGFVCDIVEEKGELKIGSVILGD